MFIGIEIGGTKLQLGIGRADGVLTSLWRGNVDVAAGPEGIRAQIQHAVPELLAKSNIPREQVRAVGIGFGGPVDSVAQRIIRSHQIPGWDDFPLAQWVSEMLNFPVVLGNDADLAGLAEALYGAGHGLSPVLYITIGSVIVGGLIVDGQIYTGAGKGATEVGHLLITQKSDGLWQQDILEHFASGWAIQKYAREKLAAGAPSSLQSFSPNFKNLTTQDVATAAQSNDPFAQSVLHRAISALAQAICQVIVLLCPKRIIIGGGVSLIGEKLLFQPLRQMVDNQVFKPFKDLTEIVPAQLGEEMVVHGAIALAARHHAPPDRD